MKIIPSLVSETAAIPPSAYDDVVERARKIWPVLQSLEKTYPGFRNWYWSKVVPDLETGKRKLFVDGQASSPRGLAIAKRDDTESKICTLWVAPLERRQGLGRNLLEQAIEWIGTAHPLFTVPQERYTELLPLVRRFGFSETARIESLYRSGVIEHIFNGS